LSLRSFQKVDPLSSLYELDSEWFFSYLIRGRILRIFLNVTVTDSAKLLPCFSVGLSLSIEIEVEKITRAENHACHEKQTKSLPVPYCPQSENLWHGNVPEELKNRRHKENHHDRETDEN
jgi:hypothetical protein